MLRYAVPMFVGAFLLFQVQPMVARVILPWFGGTPSVWTACMLFFQVLLVVGYAYSHFLATRAVPSRQALLHTALIVVSLGALGLMALAWGAPIVPTATWKPPDSSLPILRILATLTVAVGLPYFVLATTSPLLQAWFTRTESGASPYRLYSLSNAGSLLGLLSYPFLIEPALAQKQQAGVWTLAYVVFAAGCGVCAWHLWRARCTADTPSAAAGDAPPEEATPPSARDRLFWLVLPALASVLLLAVTNHLCQDVAVTPFLWVLPLSLYLLTFIICFDHERWYQRWVFLPVLIVAAPLALGLLPYVNRVHIVPQIATYGVALFACCMVCHGELVALKPAPRHLTSFYLSVAVGGALGGLLVGVVAPRLFTGYTELPLALLACLIIGLFTPGLPRPSLPTWSQLGRLVLVGGAIALALIPQIEQMVYSNTRYIAVSRNFYGVLRVREQAKGTPDQVRLLLHGRIIHGIQFQSPKLRRVPTSYYGPESGVALAIRRHPRRMAADPAERSLRIGVVGLGIGTVAAFAEPRDTVRFYEINPEVVRMAYDPALFTYLTDCPGKVEVVLGDGRISLERELQQGSQQFDLLLLDAFSSDAVPAHLLTKEAFEIYLQHLRQPDGVILVDVSNGRVDLPPVVWKTVEHFGLDGCLVSFTGDSRVVYSSYWMPLTVGRSYLRSLDLKNATWTDTSPLRIRLWTDDYYNLFQIVK